MQVCVAGMSARLPAAPHAASTDVDLREHHPAANPAQDTYTMLKFYNLQSALVKSVMDGLNDEAIDFPFRVSPSEQRIIELDPSSSIILVGERRCFHGPKCLRFFPASSKIRKLS